MDIEKLEKLSCLSLSSEQKNGMSKSIDGVLDMLHEIDKVKLPHMPELSLPKTVFREGSGELFEKASKISGLHIEDGHFLAPKVIKKG